MFTGLKTFIISRLVGQFFGVVPNSIKNHLNLDELVRVSLSAVMAGGGIFGLLLAIAAHAGQIFVFAPTDMALATAFVTFVTEALRRLSQGVAVAIPPTPPSATIKIRRVG